MTNSIKYLIAFAAGAMALTSCSNFEEDIPTVGGEKVNVRFYADMASQDDSRAEIIVGDDSFTGTWDTTDVLGVLAKAPNTSTAILEEFTYDGASFTGTLSSSAKGAWSYNAFYPYTRNTKVDGTKVSLPFGNTRTQISNLYNSDYDALVAAPVAYTNAEPGKSDEGKDIHFDLTRLTSILNFKIAAGSTTDKVKALLLTSKSDNQKLSAATLGFDVAAGSAAMTALGTEDLSNMIAMTFEKGQEPAANNIDAFFNLVAGNYDELTFDVITATKQISTMTIRRNDAQKPFVAGKLHKYEKSEAPVFAPLAAPSLNWPDQDMDETHEITVDEEGLLTYAAAIGITVPGGLTALEVDITSVPLNDMGLTKLDLINEKGILGGVIPYEDLGLSCGTQIQYAKSIVFDITALVPMIAAFTDTAIGNHIFSIKVTDLAGQTTMQDLTFSITAPKSAVYNNDADLWKNTASLTIAPATGTTIEKAEYRIKGETTWNTAELGKADAQGIYHNVVMAPTWTESTNAAGKRVYTANPKTGIYAQNTYEWQVTIGGKVAHTGEFTPENNAGDIIPNGDMEDNALSCFTSDNKTTTLWGSGNNSFASALCTQSTFNGMGGSKCAKLSATMAGIPGLFTLLAAGNIFTATFDKPSTKGTVGFGQNWPITARPTAIRVKYYAEKLGIVDQNSYKGPLEKGAQDKARIFACIVNWSEQHKTISGMGNPTGIWDPSQNNNWGPEGDIIGYGLLDIDKQSEGGSMISVDIPIYYYDRMAKPTSQYKVVISAATSAYGDNMNGCSTNVMYVDDFEWVY